GDGENEGGCCGGGGCWGGGAPPPPVEPPPDTGGGGWWVGFFFGFGFGFGLWVGLGDGDGEGLGDGDGDADGSVTPGCASVCRVSEFWKMRPTRPATMTVIPAQRTTWRSKWRPTQTTIAPTRHRASASSLSAFASSVPTVMTRS